jgi:hypothetical protein
LDRQRAAHYGNDPRQERGSAVDVGGAYNTTFLTVKHAGARTSMIVDPPNGRLIPEKQRARNGFAAAKAATLTPPRPRATAGAVGSRMCLPPLSWRSPIVRRSPPRRD